MGSQDAFMLGDQWRTMMRLLPDDLEQSALQTGALSRKRQVRDAQTLIRLILAYCYLDLSLRDVSAWAQQAGVAQLSDVAILKRLRGAADWVAHLVGQELAQRGLACVDQEAPAAKGRRLRVMDASTVVAPGSCPTTKGHDGRDWRVHLSLSLLPLRVDEVHLTDWTGGESLSRFELSKGDICLCDRGYAHRAAIAAVVAAGADVIVRLPWKNLPLLDVAEEAAGEGGPGQPFDILGRVDERLRTASAGAVCEFDVQTAPDPKNGVPAVRGRLVAVKKSAEAAERARREARAKARTHGRTLDERTLAACDYVFVFTTLPADEFDQEFDHEFDHGFDATQILALYRLRWQVELCFKRLKSIIGLEQLRAKDPQLARTYLMGKLLTALFVDGLAHRWLGFSPWDSRDYHGPFEHFEHYESRSNYTETRRNRRDQLPAIV